MSYVKQASRSGGQVERMAEFILIILALLVLDETRNLALIILGIVLFYFLVL